MAISGRRRKIALLGLAAVLLLLACRVAYYYVAEAPTGFDRDIWLAGEKVGFSSDAPRLRMADGLVKGGTLLGMTKSQVDAMLGPQSDTPYFRPAYDYVYWLGAERGYISIDSEWLVLKVGPGGKITEALIVRD